jgi:uncharacterized integral membrane protein
MEGQVRSGERQVGSGGRGFRFWLLGVLSVVAFAFIAVNFQKVTIDFIVGEAQAPLVLALLISGLLGFVIGLVVAGFRRHDTSSRR